MNSPGCCQGQNENSRGNEYHRSELLAVQCDQSIKTSLIASSWQDASNSLSSEHGISMVDKNRLSARSRVVRSASAMLFDRNHHICYYDNNYHYHILREHEQEIETKGSYYPGAERHDIASLCGMDIRAGEERDTQHRSGHSLPKPQTTEEGGSGL